MWRATSARVPTDLGLSLVFAEDGRVLDAAVTPQRGGQWLVQLPHIGVTAQSSMAAARTRARPSGAGDGRTASPGADARPDRARAREAW